MKGDRERAYLLHRRDYRESSFLLEFLTQESGYVRLLARGARRGQRAIAGILQPFQPLLIAWRGTSELPSLTLCEPQGSPSAVAGERIYSGFYVNEVTCRMAYRHEIDPNVFHAYEAVLTAITSMSDSERDLRIYEMHLLRAAGLGLLLDRCGTQTLLDPDETYGYEVDSGPLLGHEAANTVRIKGKTLLSMKCEDFTDPVTLREAKHLMRFVLRNYLGAKPLASRTLYADYQRQMR